MSAVLVAIDCTSITDPFIDYSKLVVMLSLVLSPGWVEELSCVPSSPGRFLDMPDGLLESRLVVRCLNSDTRGDSPAPFMF